MESNDIGHSLEMLPCQFCCRLFRTSFGLLSHQRDFHHHLDIGISDLDSSIEKDNYTCKTCNRTLNNYIGLLAHQRDTHGIEPQYFLPQSLSLTTRIGTTESIVSLPGNFSGIIALPYRCSRCRRSFRTMLDLRAHEKDSHSISIVAATTDPTFSGDMIPCDRCRRVFRTMFGLYTHKRDAHGIIPDQISVSLVNLQKYYIYFDCIFVS